MSQNLLDVLSHSTPAEARQRLNLSARELDAQVLQLTASLNGYRESPEGQAIFSYVQERSREDSIEAQRASRPLIYPPELVELREWARRRYLPMTGPITPELLEWARRTIDMEQLLAGMREIEATGGLDIKDLIDEVEQEVPSRE
jgi:hypothetical protein